MKLLFGVRLRLAAVRGGATTVICEGVKCPRLRAGVVYGVLPRRMALLS